MWLLGIGLTLVGMAFAILGARAAGLVLLVLYQVFRMGYYGLLIPNTALAKESGRAVWGRGRLYAQEFLAGTHIFALACPLAALPRPAMTVRRSGVWALTALVVIALGAVGTVHRWDPGPFVPFPDGVVDERDWWSKAAHNPDPVTLGDYERAPFVAGAQPPEGMVWDLLARETLPGRDTVAAYGAVGILGASLPEVRIADTMSLTDPVGAHFEPGPVGRAGHEKPVLWAWIVRRYAADTPSDPTARAARQALGCGDLAELVGAVEDPLTPGRFLDNLFGSVSRTTLRVPSDPVAARDQLCG